MKHNIHHRSLSARPMPNSASFSLYKKRQSVAKCVVLLYCTLMGVRKTHRAENITSHNNYVRLGKNICVPNICKYSTYCILLIRTKSSLQLILPSYDNLFIHWFCHHIITHSFIECLRKYFSWNMQSIVQILLP